MNIGLELTSEQRYWIKRLFARKDYLSEDELQATRYGLSEVDKLIHLGVLEQFDTDDNEVAYRLTPIAEYFYSVGLLSRAGI